MIRAALISACDAAILTMALCAGLVYVFRWPLVVIWAVATLAKAL